VNTPYVRACNIVRRRAGLVATKYNAIEATPTTARSAMAPRFSSFMAKTRGYGYRPQAAGYGLSAAGRSAGCRYLKPAA
jgi:hypothetical protein